MLFHFTQYLITPKNRAAFEPYPVVY